MIDVDDIVTLSDGLEYVVVSKADFNSKKYYYLADVRNNGNLKFLYLDKNELVEVQDFKTVESIFPILIDNYNIKK